MGGGRDIPPNAKFHRSVLDRMTMKGIPKYEPINDVFINDTAHSVELRKVLASDGPVSAASEQPLLHLEFKQSETDKDLYCIKKK